MCYDASYLTKRALDYAKLRGHSPQTIADLEKQWEQVKKNLGPKFHTSGFEHPYLVGYKHEPALQVQTFYWGLIPFWVKDGKSAQQMAHRTLNARGETIFEKPAFRSSAKNHRAVVVVDQFFEHHHHKGKTYPFLIKRKDEAPLHLGALWSEWVNKETGEVLQSASIVTTTGNKLLSKIHNNPKMKGPRMPVILNAPATKQWLDPNQSKAQVQDLIKPYADEALEAYSVGRLRGKNAIGNQPEVLEKVDYPNLELTVN
jgi:putative SOS response-associated peptidase YedK